RAQTSQAKIQVELAYLQYIMPRLKKMWSHLERQRGGIGTRGGAGEKELETDRRIIRGKISKLKAKLLVIEKQAFVQRKNRSDMIRVSLVGYTNAGKTTLMNKLCKSELFAEDKLFATLDTTVRKAVAKDIPYLLSDTVGFIRKLPQHLMESFHTTLEEAKEADVLLHVVDLAHPSFEEHIQIVNKTLEEIEADKTETILVFNKMDAYFEMMKRDVDPFFSKDDIENLKSTWMGKLDGKVVFISALKNENIDELKNLIFEHVKELYIRRYPYKARYYS
ncbi:MAG: GTPase HflX, partial [Bacteroidetes bacterium]|nr:GTPase HflX [Bacteroidota bacterium]